MRGRKRWGEEAKKGKDRVKSGREEGREEGRNEEDGAKRRRKGRTG